MRFSLRQVEVFLAVARFESVSRAARTLAMSQSAASSALGELERQFGVRLFDRLGKRLRLTDLGRAVRVRAEAVLAEGRELEATLAGTNHAPRLRVGATMTIGNYLAVPLVARFLREQPGADVALTVANTESIARQVANFELDLGLIEGEIDHEELVLTPWRDDDLVVFCAPSHPLARRRVLTDDHLRTASWIVRERGSGTRQAFDRAMRGLLPDLDIAMTLEHTEAIKGAVESGLGVGCVSRIAVADALERGTLHACRVPHRDFRRQFFFLLHRHKHRGPAIEAWLACCRECRDAGRGKSGPAS